MLLRKGPVPFIIRLLIIYTLLVLPWPGVRKVYGNMFRVAARAVLGSTGELRVEFRSVPDGSKKKDVNLVVKRSGSRTIYETPIDSRLSGYLPTVTALALILATAIPWTRKWKALIWGMVGIHIFIWFRLWVAVLYSHSVARLSPTYEFSEGWTRFIYHCYEIVGRSPTTTFMVPVVIWALVTLRRSDFESQHPPADARTTQN